MFRVSFLVLLALLPCVMAQVPIPYSDCGSSHVKVLTAEISQWPPAIGTPTTIMLSANLDEQLTGGAYLVDISVDGFPIINQQGTLQSLNVTFPVNAGTYSFNKTFTIPSIVPAGTALVANVSTTDQNGQELLCISLEFTVGTSVTDEQEQQQLTDMEFAAIDDEQEQDMEMMMDDQTETVDESADPFDFSNIVGYFFGSDETDEAEVDVDSPDYDYENSYDQDEQEGDFMLPVMYDEEPDYDYDSAPSFGEMVMTLSDAIAFGDVNVTTDFVPFAPVQVPFTNCGQATDIITIEDVTSTVWPPVLGSTATVIATFTVNEQVTGGTYAAILGVDGFPLTNKDGNLSDFISMPIAKGPLSISKSITMPASLPFSGSIGIQITATNDNSQELFCINVAFQI